MNSTIQIPRGRTAAVIKARETVIHQFYAAWMAVNPEKRIFPF